MPVSVVCESAAANVNAAIRDSLANSPYVGLSTTTGGSASQTSMGGHHHHHHHHDESLQNKLAASTKRVLLTKIEYEEVKNYNQTVLDTLKSKYMVLTPTPSPQSSSTSSSSSSSSLCGANSGKLMHAPATTTATSSNSFSSSSSLSLSSSSSSTSTTGMNGNDKDSNQSPATATTGGHHNSSCTSSTTLATSEKSRGNSNELPQPKRILFPRENVQIGWKSSNRKWHVGAGMMNVGNTCYLNSILQALFHVPAIANWLMSDTQHRERCEEENGTQGGCIICAMSKTLISSQQQQSAIRPYLVYSKLKSICRHLIMGRQEDAHEFLRYLVEAMEKAYLMRYPNYKDLDQFSKETTPPNQILGGYLKSAVRCLACGHVSTTFQHFEDLLLDIRKADTIEEALEGYFSRERLEDMGYKCESCKKKVSATKQFSLERAPIALCIQLKRFSMLGTKLNKQITIRPRLDLSRFASKKNGEQLTYKLVAMVTHLGASQHCGHYTAIGLTESGTYYSFDDSYVRPISVQSVVNTNAYIIFYEMESGQQHSTQTATNSRPHTQINGNLDQAKENNQKNGAVYSSNGGNNENRQSFYGSSTIGPKVISKLNTDQKIIGPQLPDFYKTNNGSASNGFPGNGNKLVNSPSKLSNRPNSIPTNSSKIMIHFKNSAALMNGSATTTSACTSSATASAATSSTDKLKSNPSASDSEAEEDEKVTTTSNEVSSTTTTATAATTLPSMPKLGLSSPMHSKDKANTSKLQPVASTTAAGVATSTTSTNGALIKSPLKSLVPYESESEDDSWRATGSGSSSDEKQGDAIIKTSPISTTSTTQSTKPPAKKKKKKTEFDWLFKRRATCPTNGNDNSCVSSASAISPKKKKTALCSDTEVVANDFDENSHDSMESSASVGDLKQAQSTPPSPPVIKTKTGLWQVTNVQPSGAEPNSTSDKKYRNPFAVERSSSPDKRSTKHSNFNSKPSNGFQPKVDTETSEVVNELKKQSHRGYGASVVSWSGTKTELEKEITEEARLQRKREWDEDDENEMDRGRQKKVKPHKQSSSNPGYNPFQEQQSQQNQYQRRWKLVNNATNHRYQNTSTGHFRMGNTFNRKVNNFKRFGNKFHQRPHHQRSNGGDFHRRDS